MPNLSFSFGTFTLDLDNHALVREGAPVAVSHRGLMLLAALVRKAGSVVSKEELMNAVWPNVVVEEGNLATQVGLLRGKAIATLIEPGLGGEISSHCAAGPSTHVL